MDDIITKRKFSEIDSGSKFFLSLKTSYPEFDDWFKRKKKSNEEAFVHYNEENEIDAFLYLKDESSESINLFPNNPLCRRLKIGTFKITPHNTLMGEKFLKIIFDTAMRGSFEEIYVTVFPVHEKLISMLKEFGFEEKTKKGEELVLVRKLKNNVNDDLKDFPIITGLGKRNIYVLSIYPRFHTKLFPDSILKNELSQKAELITDVSYTNSIHKIYISFIKDTALLKKGDVIVVYRTSDGTGPARYRSVVTSVCVIEEVKTKTDFMSINDFLEYTKKYSVFSEIELLSWYNKNFVVIKMMYNFAFQKRITRGDIIDKLNVPEGIYWGFFRLQNEQFNRLVEMGCINEGFIVD